MTKQNKEIIEKVLKEVVEDGEASVEGFHSDMLQFSMADINGYLKSTISEKDKKFEDFIKDLKDNDYGYKVVSFDKIDKLKKEFLK